MLTDIVGGFICFGLLAIAIRLIVFLLNLGRRVTHDVVNYADGGKPTVVQSRRSHSGPVTYVRPSGVRITFTDDE